MAKKSKKIVTIGGGSGQYSLLSGLRDIKGVEIIAVVSMVDSGGSTGRLRDELGVLPPGDVLKCLLALSPFREAARKILQTKFKNDNRLNGHNAGNMLLSMLAQYAGSFPFGIEALGEILKVKGKVLPVTVDRATLAAELDNGEYLYGETAIDVSSGRRAKIKRTFLVPHHNDSIKVYSPVMEAIKEADFIVIGPGDLYTSIIPNFLVPGVTEEIKKAKGKLIYAVNIMTKFGETDKFKAGDFIKVIEEKIKRRLDFILINSSQPDKKLIKKYAAQKAEIVMNNFNGKAGGRHIIVEDFLHTHGDIARHNSKKLASVIGKIINNKI